MPRWSVLGRSGTCKPSLSKMPQCTQIPHWCVYLRTRALIPPPPLPPPASFFLSSSSRPFASPWCHRCVPHRRMSFDEQGQATLRQRSKAQDPGGPVAEAASEDTQPTINACEPLRASHSMGSLPTSGFQRCERRERAMHVLSTRRLIFYITHRNQLIGYVQERIRPARTLELGPPAGYHHGTCKSRRNRSMACERW